MENTQVDIGDLIISFEEKGYVHFHFIKTNEPIISDVVKKGLSIIKERLDHKTCLLVTIEEGATLTQEAREYASSKDFDALILADAIVRSNYSHEMAANFFIRFNRPNRPVKLFPNKKKAIAWIEEILKENS